MQIDFHYYVIRILAEKAGFSPADSQIIAYASQFVDDATEHKPLQLPEKLQIKNHPRLKEGNFDPVCTAHKGLQFVNDFRKIVQMKIYISFHFLPPKIYTNTDLEYDYVTKPNSQFANILIEKIKKQFVDNPDEKLYNLISLGIALHTYADTWAHQNFSGRHNHENNVEKIKKWNKGKWKSIKTMNRIRNSMLPEIGHAEAYSFPDQPFRTWKYKKAKNKSSNLRHNLDVFIDAAENIYKFLLSITDKYNEWNSFSDRLIQCLSYTNESIKKRKNKYRKLFPEIGFYYNENQWRNDFFKENYNHKTCFLQEENDYKKQKWLEFHRAAISQREFVLKNSKPLY